MEVGHMARPRQDLWELYTWNGGGAFHRSSQFAACFHVNMWQHQVLAFPSTGGLSNLGLDYSLTSLDSATKLSPLLY